LAVKPYSPGAALVWDARFCQVVNCGTYLFFFRLRLASDDIHHTVLQRLLVLRETVLLPGIVHHFGVEIVTRHARVEQAVAVLVVRLLLKLQRPGVLQEVLELGGLAAAEFFKRSFDFLLLNIGVLLVLAAPG